MEGTLEAIELRLPLGMLHRRFGGQPLVNGENTPEEGVGKPAQRRDTKTQLEIKV